MPQDRPTMVNLLRALNALGEGSSDEAKDIAARIRELEEAEAIQRGNLPAPGDGAGNDDGTDSEDTGDDATEK